ncbi:MarR family winged helix-turn-helix transcriptional regulator [Arthrobacter caoxuetaonis]|uniref:MarR family transcriptional regulator n=1 Tax=Arthrobacter caoxuetaonis TaxID=2886935 RepID=A0A9X1MGI3_9MICC|nr:MarR family transcriptional regulator [Arthrobacter caoxuetaonis]MCC3298952.1 MarR family transcriptional regulator [Arthrobacter caoxuetaonis]USQ58704.1 MarR family transcriptional regulator [Arthrobacter caoxuetaonis]
MPNSDADSAALGELMHAAFRGLRGRWIQQLAPFELTPHQYRALNAMGRNADDGGMRLKDLADRLRIAPRSATEVVDQLEAKGLVERGPDPSDRRATLIALTPAGTRMREGVRRDRAREADEYFAALSSDDRSELARILGQLAGDMPRRHPKP